MRRVKSRLHGDIVLSGDVLVVPAEAYASFDYVTDGIVESDICAEDAFPLATEAPGTEVYFRSPNPGDWLDDTTPESEAATHIWWRGTGVD